MIPILNILSTKRKISLLLHKIHKTITPPLAVEPRCSNKSFPVCHSDEYGIIRVILPHGGVISKLFIIHKTGMPIASDSSG